jgi:chorismate dehydratase
VIAYAGIPGLSVIPDVAIAADGPVRSILLVCKKPIEEIRTVAADTSSRTSVALTRILLRKWYGGGRTFTSMAPKLDDMLDECDAALLIGDPALSVSRKRYHVYDIAEEWKRRTGKAFVFAFWAVRDAVAEPRLAPIFQHSRDHGLEPANLKWIAREWAPRVRLSEEDVISYLTRNIHFGLDAAKLDGMKLFFEYAVEVGIVAAVPPLRFIEAEAPATAV